MKTFTRTLVLLLLLAPAPAGGQTEEDPCAPEAQRSSQLMACAQREFRQASAELTRARADLNADLEPRSRVKMRAAERLWLRYRKTNCDAEASIYEGGTIQPLIELRCMTRVTRERAAELKAQIQTLRGD
ncbi:MAG: lysozyme inhibitor LprI family protein [Pyrinomonadaceae bacterium]